MWRLVPPARRLAEAWALPIGGLGGAGLAIGGGAVAIPAIVVVGAPALAVGAVAFAGWKVFKAIKGKK